jgi:hypothetical protein
MRRNKFQAQVISGSIAGGLLAGLALVFAGCPDEAADCHNTLSCTPPSCAEAGDVQGCIPDDNGEDGGNDAQED